MCTVTFLTFAGQCFITSNRDEDPARQSTGLTSVDTYDGMAIHYPLDETSGGSWIALTDHGRSVCLLNGGFEPFVRESSYRESRGQVVLSAAAAADIDQFISGYNFEGIAPFTLLIYERDNFHQLVWDGQSRHTSLLSTQQPQIWSSVTLYPPPVRAWRKALFEKWIMQTDHFDRESIITFHQMANGNPENDFVMNRNEIVKTLSITSISLKEQSGSMLYLDLGKELRQEILIHYDR